MLASGSPGRARYGLPSAGAGALAAGAAPAGFACPVSARGAPPAGAPADCAHAPLRSSQVSANATTAGIRISGLAFRAAPLLAVGPSRPRGQAPTPAPGSWVAPVYAPRPPPQRHPAMSAHLRTQNAIVEHVFWQWPASRCIIAALLSVPWKRGPSWLH